MKMGWLLELLLVERGLYWEEGIMLGRSVLNSARSLLAATGLLLIRNPGPDETTGPQRLLRELTAGGAPAKLLCAVVGCDPASPVIRCRFTRDSDLDACACWVGVKVRTWLRQSAFRDCDLEVSHGMFEPVVEARCQTR
jgi:hypothetical protein